MEEQAPYPRFQSRGRAYAYLLPCLHEDILKVGFSREPLRRLHALHRRYFEFFDLDRALLIECTRVRDARRIEREFIEEFAELSAPAPLVVRQIAGGHTEWFRGGYAQMTARVSDLAERHGGVVHGSLRRWLHDQLARVSDQLWQWSERIKAAIDYECFNLRPEQRSPMHARVLRDTLDAFDALGFDLEQLLPGEVLRWYRARPLFDSPTSPFRTDMEGDS